MKPPIYVYEPCDLSVFTSVEEAERWIEAVDVRNGVYSFFDAEGKMLQGTVFTDSRGIELCRISEQNDAAIAQEELRGILIHSLDHIGKDRGALELMTMEALVRESVVLATR